MRYQKVVNYKNEELKISHIFLVEHFLIAVQGSEVCPFEDYGAIECVERGGRLASLRLFPSLPQAALQVLTFKDAYLESVNSYQKVINYKNKDLDLIYPFIIFSKLLNVF